jgi:hypothetical protein
VRKQDDIDKKIRAMERALREDPEHYLPFPEPLQTSQPVYAMGSANPVYSVAIGAHHSPGSGTNAIAIGGQTAVTASGWPTTWSSSSHTHTINPNP